MKEYLPILMFLIVAVGFAAGTIALSSIIVPRRSAPVKMAAYECGVEPVGDARSRFSIKFYLVAVLFVIFDVEVIFLYPWAVVFRQLGAGALIAMGVFLFVLTLGLVYEFKRRALEWE